MKIYHSNWQKTYHNETKSDQLLKAIGTLKYYIASSNSLFQRGQDGGHNQLDSIDLKYELLKAYASSVSIDFGFSFVKC